MKRHQLLNATGLPKLQPGVVFFRDGRWYRVKGHGPGLGISFERL